jgi:hypothetical protein
MFVINHVVIKWESYTSEEISYSVNEIYNFHFLHPFNAMSKPEWIVFHEKSLKNIF